MNSHNVIMDEDIKRNPAEFAVLGALNLQDSHGYKIVALLQEGLSEICWLGRSQIYALLSRLEQAKLVTHERVEQMNLPARKVFSLMPEGRSLFSKWVASPVPHTRDLRVEFMIKLFFARLESETMANSLIAQQIAVCREKLSKLIEIRSESSKRIFREAIDYRISMLQAGCAWLENLVEESLDIDSQTG